MHCDKCGQPLEPWEVTTCELCGEILKDSLTSVLTQTDKQSTLHKPAARCSRETGNQQGAKTMNTAAAVTEYAVLNVNSRELLSDWVASREEAEQLARECEQHESQPECKVVSRNTVAIVCGKTIQIDRSGVGHNWCNLPIDELTEDLEDLLAAEILDGGDHGRVTIGGVRYRWQ